MIHPLPDIPTLDALGRCLIESAYAASSQRNLNSHIKIYISFCEAVFCYCQINYTICGLSRVSRPRLWYYLFFELLVVVGIVSIVVSYLFLLF